MNTKRSRKWGLIAAAAACVTVVASSGCELLVDFDRSKIPQEGGLEDVTLGDAPEGETSTADAGSDSGMDGTMPTDAAGDSVTTGDSPTSDGPSTTDSPSDVSQTDASADVSVTEAGGDAPVETSTQDAAAADGGGEAGTTDATAD